MARILPKMPVLPAKLENYGIIYLKKPPGCPDGFDYMALVLMPELMHKGIRVLKP
jgi:hypothetical protein